MNQRSPFEIARETTPADALDAMATVLGEAGAPRSVNGLHWLGPEQFFGRAVTLRSLPARPDHLQNAGAASQAEYGMSPFNLAVSLLDSDHLLVIETRGTGHFAAGGGTGLTPAFARRAAAIVTDGALRDSSHLESLANQQGTCVAAGGFTCQYGSGWMLYPAEVNVPVALGHALVLPGDFLFGNRDGVVVIPSDNAEEILELAVVNSKLAQAIEHLALTTEKLPGVDILTTSPQVVAYLKMHCPFTARQKQLADLYLIDEFQ
jgi:regulator of RNase E activity RraA